jgi:hypothetical protein
MWGAAVVMPAAPCFYFYFIRKMQRLLWCAAPVLCGARPADATPRNAKSRRAGRTGIISFR